MDLIFKLTSETLEYHSVAPHISYTMLYHVISILLPPQPGRALVAALFGTIFLPVSTVAGVGARGADYRLPNGVAKAGDEPTVVLYILLGGLDIVVNSDGFL